uniref:Uncharacterized protein n=1 Tax=Panthera leo TaxID=9689 RepID=A0A8C8WAA3_PANLE
ICEPEPSVSASQSLLEAAGPEPLSQHPQASHSREYLPFFRTYGTLLAVGELVSQPEACRDQEGDQTVRDPAFHEDSEPPSGFFPFYRSKEECFPRLALPGRSCWGSRDPCTRKEALAGCWAWPRGMCLSPLNHLPGSSRSPPCCPILLVPEGHCHDSGLTAPASSDAAFKDHALGASGFVPYYRTLEEELRASPGPPVSPLGSQDLRE